ncbi:hypothetical protein BJ508DRAFT_343562 [Ascobolus immersus RN42]|uniref:BTB domain-containing protein n=1 Tax=Ascobolus immersus RN42 TaxID=1160509 RepID=A0A3N4HG63_ASCIM|nr:hypothetical protein BJ508DRAFT_343562 [Ascobolus immersus RN42]
MSFNNRSYSAFRALTDLPELSGNTATTTTSQANTEDTMDLDLELEALLSRSLEEQEEEEEAAPTEALPTIAILFTVTGRLNPSIPQCIRILTILDRSKLTQASPFFARRVCLTSTTQPSQFPFEMEIYLQSKPTHVELRAFADYVCTGAYRPIRHYLGTDPFMIVNMMFYARVARIADQLELDGLNAVAVRDLHYCFTTLDGQRMELGYLRLLLDVVYGWVPDEYLDDPTEDTLRRLIAFHVEKQIVLYQRDTGWWRLLEVYPLFDIDLFDAAEARSSGVYDSDSDGILEELGTEA